MTNLEVFDTAPERVTVLDRLEWFFTNKRHWIRQWMSKPPHGLGWALFFLVVAELTIAGRVVHGGGSAAGLIRQFLRIGVGLAMAEFLFAKIGQEAARLTNKDGSFFGTVAFLNLSLAPLFLYLPLAILCWAAGHSDLRLFVFLLLGLKVLANWKTVIQITFSLSRIQCTIAFFIAAACGYIAVLGVLWLDFASRLATFVR